MLAEIANGVSVREISAKYNVPVRAIYGLRKRHMKKNTIIDIARPTGATVDIMKPPRVDTKEHYEPSGFIHPPSLQRLMAGR